MKSQSAAQWNISGFEKEFKKHPRDLNVADKKSALYPLKEFEKEIYLNLFFPYFKKLPRKGLVLDAGCGVGRFSKELLRRGFRVHASDASRLTLDAAQKNFGSRAKDALRIHADAENLSMLPDAMYDAVFAVELLCYVKNPEKAIKELARVLKKGGLLFFSVENKFGALCSERFITENNFMDAFKKNELSVKNEAFVRYFTKADVHALIKKAKLGTLYSAGCHYVADGIFGHLAGKANLRDMRARKKLHEIESLCRKNKSLALFARAWTSVAKKI